MNKQYRLPKDFAEKWLEELRSGKYEQAQGGLVMAKSDGIKGYCCLGVSAKVLGYDDVFLGGYSFIYNSRFDGPEFPKEICGVVYENNLVRLLTSFNDGLTLSSYNYYKDLYDNAIFRHQRPEAVLKEGINFTLNFEQIADFIEDNCEFY